MSFNIEVEGGKSVRLPTAGKYCDRDIVVTATGGGDGGSYDQGYADGKQDEYDRLVDETKIIEKTVTGSVIRVDDVSEIPHKCVIAVDKDATVTICGKNLADPTLIDGFHTETNIRYAYSNGVLLPKGTYTATAIADISYVGNFNIRRHDDKSVIASGGVGPITFTLTEPTAICWNVNLAYPVTKDNYKSALRIQIEEGTVATAYETYQGYVQLPITVAQPLEVDSICPTMTLYADNSATVTLDYHKSYGAQTEYDRFWDTYQQNGNRTDHWCAFGGYGWTDETFQPKYDIRPTAANYMFFQSQITDLKKSLADCGVTLDFSQCTIFTHFVGVSQITTLGVVDTRSADSLASMFTQRCALVSVDKIILREDGSQTTPSFNAMPSLVDIRFEGKFGVSVSFAMSQYLSSDSVDSIINALKDMTGTTAQKLTLHASAGARLTDAQKSAISAKNWTVVY